MNETGQSTLRLLGMTVTVILLMPCLMRGAAALPNQTPYVILTDLSQDDPYFAAVIRLQQHRTAQVIRFTAGRESDMLEKLRTIQPMYVAVLVKPERLDINFAYDILEVSTKVDDDPFTDFAYGYITGATATDTIRFVENCIRAESGNGNIPQRLFMFGPSNLPQVDSDSDFGWLPKWKHICLAHEPGTFPQKRLGDFSGNGLIRFWGHGSPEGIDNGLSYTDIKLLELYPAIVFAGPCFSAVVGKSYNWQDVQKVTVQTVTPEKSLALNFISRGVTAYFGALQEDKCLNAGQEMEYALTMGEPLGLIIKRTYDAAIMANDADKLSFLRVRNGEVPPKKDCLDLQIHQALGRILLGDPAFRPFSALGKSSMATEYHQTERGFEVGLTVMDTRYRCTLVSPFRSDLCSCGTANDTLYTKIELPPDFGPIHRVTLDALPSPLSTIAHSDVRWRQEKWQGKHLLHLQIDLKHDSLHIAKEGAKLGFLVHTHMGEETTEK